MTKFEVSKLLLLFAFLNSCLTVTPLACREFTSAATSAACIGYGSTYQSDLNAVKLAGGYTAAFTTPTITTFATGTAVDTAMGTLITDSQALVKGISSAGDFNGGNDTAIDLLFPASGNTITLGSTTTCFDEFVLICSQLSAVWNSASGNATGGDAVDAAALNTTFRGNESLAASALYAPIVADPVTTYNEVVAAISTSDVSLVSYKVLTSDPTTTSGNVERIVGQGFSTTVAADALYVSVVPQSVYEAVVDAEDSDSGAKFVTTVALAGDQTAYYTKVEADASALLLSDRITALEASVVALTPTAEEGTDTDDRTLSSSSGGSGSSYAVFSGVLISTLSSCVCLLFVF